MNFTENISNIGYATSAGTISNIESINKVSLLKKASLEIKPKSVGKVCSVCGIRLKRVQFFKVGKT